MKTKSNKTPSHTNKNVIYGRHAVMAALKNPKRECVKVICTPENVQEVKTWAPDISIVSADRKDISRLVPADAVHQGLLLYARPLQTWTLEDLCQAADDKTNCRVLILDQVTDPQNIGAIIRSSAAFGVLAVVVQDKNAPFESGAMAKAAAGTMELVPMVRVTNLSRAVETLKKNGFWVVGMDGYAQDTVDRLDKNGKIAVIMGSEGAGMRRLVEESCDVTVRLPIAENVESLNVSTAAAIVLYELAK